MSGAQLDLFAGPAAQLDLFAAAPVATPAPSVYSLGLSGPYTILCDGQPCIAGLIPIRACAEAAVRALNTVRA